jgi:hypothetical protein
MQHSAGFFFALLDSIAQRKKYKELLDSGVITQEEFDEKSS